MSQPGNGHLNEDMLRGFLARILGWSDECRAAIEHALCSLQLSITLRAALVLLGDTPDLVSIAQALHRRTLGAERPFVVCDRRRFDMRDSARLSLNHKSGVAAIEAARGGSLCVARAGLPRDFSSMVTIVRDPATSVQLIVCGEMGHADDPYLVKPVPIQVPPLTARVGELTRIVDEYAQDAIATLDAFERDFTDADRGWVVAHAASTWAELERVTMRIVALRNSGTIVEAAERLGMKPAALRGWIRKRKLTRRGEVRS
ncbi:MAG TPA: hypothetical protein VNO30_19655 [Kofleriaceae bacterium]|nr:hypothetical protein [Kofleriaceae bacterium]